MANWYVGSVQHLAVAQWAALTAYSVGDLRRNFAAPASNASRRVWRCTTAGTSGAAEPSWTLTKGSTTNDGTVVWTEVTGNETYQVAGAWAAPFYSLEAFAAAWASLTAGDFVYVADDHNATNNTGSVLTGTSTANPIKVICVLYSGGSVPPVSADIKTTASGKESSSTGNPAYSTSAFYSGLELSNSFNQLAIGQAGGNVVRMKDSKITNTAGQTQLNTNNQGVKVELENVQFSTGGQNVNPKGKIHWKNTANLLQGSGLTTYWFSQSNQAPCDLTVENCDLAGGTGMNGKSLISLGSQCGPNNIRLIRCKLPATFTIPGSTIPDRSGADVQVIQCDNGSGIYRHERYLYEGSQVIETTIVRTGGATDGTTTVAWKIVTLANSTWEFPFESLPITIWNETTGSAITVTIYGIWGGGAVPNNDDIWLEGKYLGTAGVPLGSVATGTKADALATNAALASDSSTWGGSTTKFKMTLTFTPQEKGWLELRVKAAKTSSTFYIDPEPEISGVTVSRTTINPSGAIVAEQSGAAGGGLLVNPGLSGGLL